MFCSTRLARDVAESDARDDLETVDPELVLRPIVEFDRRVDDELALRGQHSAHIRQGGRGLDHLFGLLLRRRGTGESAPIYRSPAVRARAPLRLGTPAGAGVAGVDGIWDGVCATSRPEEGAAGTEDAIPGGAGLRGSQPGRPRFFWQLLVEQLVFAVEQPAFAVELEHLLVKLVLLLFEGGDLLLDGRAQLIEIIRRGISRMRRAAARPRPRRREAAPEPWLAGTPALR